jgi:hypothetical protein
LLSLEWTQWISYAGNSSTVPEVGRMGTLLAVIGALTAFHDELDLAPMRVKVKQRGGTAGHNGLRWIEAAKPGGSPTATTSAS